MNIPIIVRNIYDKFIEYYGEDKVDIQESDNLYDIIVYWPEVTITNEFNLSIVIWKLFSKITINSEGKLLNPPKFIRSEYNVAQWNSGYMHSHVHVIPKSNIREWQSSCLGVGPINITIAKLRDYEWIGDITGNHHDVIYNFRDQHLYEDMLVWQLFCWELDKYVHIESLHGIPYHKLREVGVVTNKDTLIDSLPVVREESVRSVKILKAFIPYLITNNILKYSFYDGSYHIGMSHIDTVLTISNAFIKWYNLPVNSELRKIYSKNSILNSEFIEVYVGNNSFMAKQSDNNCTTIYSMIDKYVLTFKGERILFTINAFNKDNDNTIFILKPQFLGYLLHKVLRFININYGKVQIQKQTKDNTVISNSNNTDNNLPAAETSYRVSEKTRAF